MMVAKTGHTIEKSEDQILSRACITCECRMECFLILSNGVLSHIVKWSVFSYFQMECFLILSYGVFSQIVKWSVFS